MAANAGSATGVNGLAGTTRRRVASSDPKSSAIPDTPSGGRTVSSFAASQSGSAGRTRGRAAVRCSAWILLIASVVTGWSLSPMGKRYLWFAPGPSVDVQGDVPHHDAGSGRPVTTGAFEDSLLLSAAPILRWCRSTCQDRRRPGRV